VALRGLLIPNALSDCPSRLLSVGVAQRLRVVGAMNPCPVWRRAGVAASLLLSACQPLPHPFAEDVPKPGSPMLTLRDTAAVAIAPLKGEPRATAEKLAPAMAAALQKRDIAASDRAVGIASYQLDGRVQAMPPSGDRAAIVVLWDLRDPSGKSVGTRAERIEAATDAWQQGKDDAVARLADAGADQIAAMLEDKAPAQTVADQGEARLAIGAITGAPGDGATALASAIAMVLKKPDLAIVSGDKNKPDLQLECAVTVDKPVAGKQHVKIVWRVRGKDGGEIGNVVQENDVPAGLLDGPWGDVAYTVAVAAQGGIMQLIARAAPDGAGNS
jgi:hypothetical protein